MSTLSELTEKSLKNDYAPKANLNLGIGLGETKTTTIQEGETESTLGVFKKAIAYPINLAKSLAVSTIQETARSGARVGLELAGVDKYEPDESASKLEKLTYNALFGGRPLKSITQTTKEFPSYAKGLGVSESISKPLAPLAVLGVTGMDFITGGKSSSLKGIVKVIAKMDKETDIISALRKIKFPEEIIESTAKTLTKVKDVNKVDEIIRTNLLKSLGKTQGDVIVETAEKTYKTTPEAQKATKLGVSAEKGIIPKELEPLAVEARKYKSAEEFAKGINPSWLEGKASQLEIRARKLKGEIAEHPERLKVERNLMTTIKEMEERAIGYRKAGRMIFDKKLNFTDFYTQATKGVGKGVEEVKPNLLPAVIRGETFTLEAGETGKTISATKKEAQTALKATKLGVSAEKGIIPKEVEEIAQTILPIRKGREIVEQAFRSDKLNLSEIQIKNIENRLEALGLSQRTVRTFDDIQKASQELGVDVRRLVSETANNRITDKEVVALKNTINTKSTELIKLERELITNPKNAQIINIKLSETNQIIDEALKKLIKGGTEAGRTVAAYKIIAEKTLDPAYWLKKAQTIANGRQLKVEEVSAIIDLIKKSDRQGLANFVSMLRNPSFAEAAITFWKAGLLTSPTTHLANIGGNITMASLMTASDVVSTGLDVMASLVTGKRTTTISVTTILAKAKGFIKGAKGAKTYLKEGIYSPELLKKWDLGRNINFKNKIFDIYTKSVFRSLGAEDILFRQAAISEAMEKQAWVISKNEGLRSSLQKVRIKELLQNPTNEMIVNSIDAAEYATFQSPNALADLIRGGKRATSEGVRTTTEFIAPFTQTPTNIAARIADFSPVGFVKAIVDFAKPSTRNQKNLIETLGRAITGSGIIAFGAYLGERGIMTGNAPENQAERDMFYAEGKQPNSIRVGDGWYRLNRISPFGNLLSLGAEMNDLSKEQEGLNLVGATTLAGVKGLTEQSFLQGISQALQVLNEPERSLQNYVERAVSGLIPSVVGRISTTIDPTMRVPDNYLEAVLNKLPIIRKTVAPKRDIFGEIVDVSGGQLNLIDPFTTVKAKDNPIIQEAKNVGAVIGLPSSTISGIKLDAHEYSLYQKVQGKLLKEMLSSMINSKGYQNMNIVDKEKAFTKVIRELRSYLNDTLFPALMIKRFNLPNDVNPKYLRLVLVELNNNDKFKNMNDKKKEKVLKKALKLKENVEE